MAATPLDRAAAVCLERFRIRPGERVVVVHNPNQDAIAHVLVDAAEAAGAAADRVSFAPLSRHGEEPPADVAAAMSSGDVLLAATDFSLSHTKARIAATERGARVATLPMITEEIFARAVDVDYGVLEREGDRYAELLSRASRCRIATELGTDVTIELDGREGRNDCGRFWDAGSFGNLPAGESYIAPLEHLGDGVLVFDTSFAGYGRLSSPVSVEVADGRARAADGEAGAWLLATLDAGGPLGRQLAELGIGTNRAAIVTGNILEDEKATGTIHVAFGTSAALGGVNAAGVHIDGVIARPSLWLDDRQVLDAGEPV
jgi:leucyl aminopeptidase (aminopeptidase T)